MSNLTFKDFLEFCKAQDKDLKISHSARSLYSGLDTYGELVNVLLQYEPLYDQSLVNNTEHY